MVPRRIARTGSEKPQNCNVGFRLSNLLKLCVLISVVNGFEFYTTKEIAKEPMFDLSYQLRRKSPVKNETWENKESQKSNKSMTDTRARSGDLPKTENTKIWNETSRKTLFVLSSFDSQRKSELKRKIRHWVTRTGTVGPLRKTGNGKRTLTKSLPIGQEYFSNSNPYLCLNEEIFSFFILFRNEKVKRRKWCYSDTIKPWAPSIWIG